MKYLKFFGAAGTVTGSCHMIVGENGRGTLVDMGMFQGPRKIEVLNRNLPSFNAQEIDNVVLTHAHLDHCGRLPLLSKMGFRGNIYMTKATRELTELVLYDAAKIAQSNDKDNPLYTDAEVEQILSHMKVVAYDQEFSVGSYKTIFRDAGHLLGSTSVEISAANGKKIVFSGDLGNTPDKILRPTKLIDTSDYVVMESTYGDRNHPQEDNMEILQNEVNSIEKNGSVLLIPAFSLERTQLVLYMLKILKRENKIGQNTPVYLDSPMGIKATEIYEKYSGLFNESLQKEFAAGDPFEFPGLIVTRSHKRSLQIHNQKGAKVIIAGSGMMSGGRIIHHAAKYLSDERNRLLIVGYQGEETLGREIVDGATEVEIEGETIPMNATLTRINNLSAHADQNMLMNWLANIKGVSKVVLVHGEDGGPRETLKGRIENELKINDIYLPQLNEEFYL